jgi:competence protein ComEC
MTSDVCKMAVSYVAGVYLAQYLGLPFILVFTGGFLLMCLFKAVCFHRPARIMVAAVLFFVAGVLGVKLGTAPAAWMENHYVQAHGRISELPEKQGDRYYYVLKTQKISIKDKDYQIKISIRLSSQAEYSYGQTLDVGGILKPFHGAWNEYGFDTAQYYRSKNIFYRMNPVTERVSDTPIRDISIYAAANHVRSNITQAVDQLYAGEEAAVLKAVLVGNKKAFSDGFKQALDQSGVGRYFYTPFLHIMLLFLIIGWCSSWLGYRKRMVVLAALLLLYGWCNSASPIFIRSVLMVVLGIWATMRHGMKHPPDLIAVTVLAIGAANPQLLFDVGLIFGVVGSIMIYLFGGFLYEKLSWIPYSWVRRTVSVSLIFSVGMLPVCAYYFNGISPYAIVLPVLMIPAVIGLLLTAPLLLTLYAVFGSAPVVAMFVKGILNLIIGLAYGICFLPFSYVYLPRPSLKWIACWMAALLCLRSFHFEKRQQGLILAVAVFSFAGMGLLGQLASFGQGEVLFVNVGQGDGAVLKMPRQTNVLIDGGGGSDYSDYNPGESIYLPYLKDHGVVWIEAAVVSHYHKDHVQGILAAVQNLHVKNLILPGVSPNNEWRLELEKAANEAGTKIHYISRDTVLNFTNGMRIELSIAQNAAEFPEERMNDTSLVARVVYGEFSCLFTGDITQAAEGQLPEYQLMPVQVVKVPHHGSATSSSEAFVRALHPQYAVIGVGEDNTYGLPAEEVLRRYERNGAAVLCTSEKGDIVLRVDKKGICSLHTYQE